MVQSLGKHSEEPHRMLSGCPAAHHPVSALQDAQLSGVLSEESNFFTIHMSYRCAGVPDPVRIRRALQVIVDRHEILRTTFHRHEGSWTQVISEPVIPEFGLVDLRDQPEASRLQVCDSIIEDLVNTPFDFGTLPLFRIAVTVLTDDSYLLTLTFHHLIFDWKSCSIFMKEMGVAYQGGATGELPERTAQFADYVTYQRAAAQGPGDSAGYWARQLAGVPVTPALTSDFPRDPDARYYLNDYPISFSPRVTAGLARVGSLNKANLFMTLLALFAVALYRESGRTDIPVYTIFDDRKRAEFREMVGMLMNEVVLRVDLSDDPTFTELLARVRRTTLQAYRHQSLPLHDVQHLTAAEAPPASMYRLKFLYYESIAEDHLDEMQASPYYPQTGARRSIASDGLWGEDIRLVLVDQGEALGGYIAYNEALFDRDRIGQLARALVADADRLTSDPSVSISELGPS